MSDSRRYVFPEPGETHRHGRQARAARRSTTARSCCCRGTSTSRCGPFPIGAPGELLPHRRRVRRGPASVTTRADAPVIAATVGRRRPRRPGRARARARVPERRRARTSASPRRRVARALDAAGLAAPRRPRRPTVDRAVRSRSDHDLESESSDAATSSSAAGRSSTARACPATSATSASRAAASCRSAARCADAATGHRRRPARS